MNLKIVIHGTELTARLIDSETSKDFASLLPSTLTMNDLFGREKFGHLPERSPPTGPRRTPTPSATSHTGRPAPTSRSSTGTTVRRSLTQA
jgi:hypothetical protein